MSTTTSARTRITFTKHATAEGGTYWTSPASQRELKTYLKLAAAANRTKLASIGGEQETGFEQAFASLAYAYISDKAPRLLDHAIGFQLVERNEDNTKAMAVFGFKLGKQWLFAPVFFLNGDLKGHELLYIKGQDAFVPMKENWVNYLMARRPHVLGEPSSKNTYQLGGIPPNLSSLRSGHYGKHAAAIDEWARPALPLLAAGMEAQARFLHPHLPAEAGRLDMAKVAAAPYKAALAHQPQNLLFDFLSSDVGLAKAAWDLCGRYPVIKQSFDRLHGSDFFYRVGMRLKEATLSKRDNLLERGPTITPREFKATAVKMAAELLRLPPDERPPWLARIKQANRTMHAVVAAELGKLRKAAMGSLLPEEKHAADDGEPKVRVLTSDDVATVKNLPELTGKEKEKLMANGYLVKDERKGDEVSRAYNTQVEVKLTNPHESGIYDVLEAPGEFGRMLVLCHPQANDGAHPFVTLIRLDDGDKAWMNAHRTTVFARDVEQADAFRSWWGGLSDKETLSKGGHYVAVSATGEGSCPFEVREVYEEDGTYKVDFDASEDFRSHRPNGLPVVWSTPPDSGTYISPYGAILRVNKRPETELRSLGGELHVPGDTFKFFKLKDPPKPKKDDEENGCGCHSGPFGDTPGSDPKPISPGDISMIQMLFSEKTAAMKMWGDQCEVSIQTVKRGHERLPWTQALFCLVRDHGLSEGQASEMLKAAQAKAMQAPVRYQVKYAYGYPASGGSLGEGPIAPRFPSPDLGSEPVGRYNSVNAIYPQEDDLPVEELSSYNTDPSVYDPFLMPDQGAMQVAQQAGQEGQKEVFDTATFSSMLKSVGSDTMIDRHLGDLMKATDRLGRLLFLFYWHGEEFSDRYGKSELPELEDAIRNAFEANGDVVLYLKEKSVEPGIDDMMHPNIDEAARN